MNKIISLGIKDWITGIGVGQHLEGGGIFAVADGINPFVNPALDSNEFGLLQSGATASDISAGVVDQVINTIIPRNLTYFYALGGGSGTTPGDFYRVTIADNAVTATPNPTASIHTVNGFIMKDAGGTEKLYYINDLGSASNYLELGTWDFATTFVDDAITTGGNNFEPTAFKPVHYWQQHHWIGNAYKLAKLDTTPTLTLAALTFDKDFVITAIADDGYYLVIGASTETGGSQKGKTKIYFWDGASTKPDKAFDVPEPSVKALKKIGNIVYAFCGNSLYALNYATEPQKLRSLDSDHSVSNQKAVSRIGDAVLWGDIDVNMYGKIIPQVPTSFSVPYSFALRATTVTALDAEINPGTIYVAGGNSKLYTISTTVGGDTSGLVARTHFIDLKDVFSIQGITVIFGQTLASGADCTLTIANRVGDSATASITFTSLGAVTRQHFPVSLKADQVYIQVTFNGGNVRIKDIILYGEKTLEL